MVYSGTINICAGVMTNVKASKHIEFNCCQSSFRLDDPEGEESMCGQFLQLVVTTRQKPAIGLIQTKQGNNNHSLEMKRGEIYIYIKKNLKYFR